MSFAKFIKSSNKKTKILTCIIIMVVIVFLIVFLLKKDTENPVVEEKEIVGIPVSLHSLDIAQDGSVIATGRVEAARQADVSFVSGGSVQSVSAKIGARVGAGQILATLDAKDELAAVAQAEAQLQLARVELENTKAGQVTSVTANSRNLISSDLRAYLTEDSLERGRSAESTPTITGNYLSDVAGSYLIEVYSSGQNSGYSFIYSGLEQGLGEVSFFAPIPLGTRGLFIQWPETSNSIGSIDWEIPVPNFRSSQYVASQNQLNQAVVSQDTTLRTQEAKIQIAQAGLSAANARLESKRLRAPFTGTVTDVSIGIGESVSGGQDAVSLISDGQKIIEITLSPRASQFVALGDEAIIDNAYTGRIAAIASAVSGDTGVRATIEITDVQADKILVGSVLSIKINTKTKKVENITGESSRDLVPLSSVVSRGGGYAVYTINDNAAVELSVGVGKISGNFIEVGGLVNVPSIIKDAFSIRADDKVRVVE